MLNAHLILLVSATMKENPKYVMQGRRSWGYERGRCTSGTRLNLECFADDARFLPTCASKAAAI